MNKKIVYGLLVLCCLMVIPLVGCSKKATDTTTKTVPKTPVQLVNDRVNSSDSINSRQDANIQDLAGRVGTLEGKPVVDLTALTARIVALEGLNYSALMDSINASLSYRIALIEARLGATPTPNGSTPTPTVTPTPVDCGVSRPSAVFPSAGNMSVQNVSGIVQFEWTPSVNANHYEFWIGTNPTNMVLFTNVSVPAHFYPFPANASNTFYYWEIVAVSPCGNRMADAWWFKTQ